MDDTRVFLGSGPELTRAIVVLEQRILELSEQVADLHSVVSEAVGTKEWYTTAEVAAMMNVTRHTVQERWCNAGRIECEKDPTTGKWRIPGHEFERLRRGGKPDGTWTD
jgi:hypothetical protein